MQARIPQLDKDLKEQIERTKKILLEHNNELSIQVLTKLYQLQQNIGCFLLPCCKKNNNTFLITRCCGNLQCKDCTIQSKIICLKCESELSQELQDLELICLICYEPIKSHSSLIYEKTLKNQQKEQFQDPQNFIILEECDHLFCLSCIREYVLTSCQQGLVNMINSCPQCLKQNLSNTVLQRLFQDSQLSQDDYIRIQNIQLKAVVSLKLDEVMKHCQTCDYAEFVDSRADRFYCINCNKTTCPQCNAEPPHYGITCKQHKQKGKEESKEEMIEGIRNCPKCNSFIEKSDGCNFMTCISTTCLRKTHFCYLCNKTLKYSQHFTHYRYQGPFGDSCNHLDSIEDSSDSDSDGE